MWNKTGKLILADFLLSLFCCWSVGLVLNPCAGLSLPSSSSQSAPSSVVTFNPHQWQSLMKDAIQFLQKHQKNQQQQQQQPQPRGENGPDHKPNMRFVVDPVYTTGGGGGGSGGGGGTGLVKLRNIRSGFGDMQNVVRLVQLHELEKEWASKARPRFGKRAEVTQDNFLPPYAYMDSQGGDDGDYDPEAGGDAKIPEDYAQNRNGDRKSEQRQRLMSRYPDTYLIPGGV